MKEAIMERVSLTCFSPLLLRGTPSCSINNNEVAAVFTSLMTDLQKLQKSLEEHSISLQWCKEAMVVLKKMHSELLQFLEKSKVPISGAVVDGLLDDEYMKDTLNILDLCNLLKSAISGLTRYRLMVDFAVKNIYDSECKATASIAEIQRLREESKKVYGAEKRKKVNLYKAGMPKTRCKGSTIVDHAISVINCCINILSMLIFSVEIFPIPIKMMDKEDFRGFSHELKPILESIERLVACFTKIFPRDGNIGSRLALVENRMIEAAIMDIQAQVTEKHVAVDRDKLVKSLELLEQRSMALKEGLEMFDSAVTQVFEEVVKGRNKVLGMITRSTTT